MWTIFKWQQLYLLSGNNFLKFSASLLSKFLSLQGTLHDLCVHTHGRESEVGGGPGSG